MKRIFLLLILIVAGGIGVTAQDVSVPCPPPYVICLTQEKANETAGRLKELIEARNVIAEYIKKDALTAAEREAAQLYVKRLNDLISLDDKVFGLYHKAIEQAHKILEMQSALIEKLFARLDKPKSGWDKFFGAMKTVANILAGIALGRALN